MQIDDIDHLRLNLIRQRRASDAGDEDAFIALDEEFHLGIADGARLPLLHAFLTQLRGFVRLMRLGTRRHPHHLEEVLAEHEALVAALEARDVGRALGVLRAHLHTREYASTVE
jgi:DNA-binding GntR family transcriptional regulator